MSIITIVGAGMMGSAMSGPAADNGHEIRLVGTPLDREIIDSVRETGFHPTLHQQLPAAVAAFQAEELDKALEGAELVIGGVSSFGVDWFARTCPAAAASRRPGAVGHQRAAGRAGWNAYAVPAPARGTAAGGETRNDPVQRDRRPLHLLRTA